MSETINLDEIKARAEAATPGPWLNDVNMYITLDTNQDVIICRMYDRFGDDYENHEANTEFIANARQDIPALVAEVERLQAENAQLQAELAELNRLQELNRDFIERMRKY